MQHKFSRIESIIGTDKLNILKQKSVLVLGLGGVGGYVCESLARSGIGTLIIIDYDTIETSNINRQIIATNKTLGRKKVEVMKERLKDINQDIKIIEYDLFFDEKCLEEIFSNKIDFIVDACDTVKSKELIITEGFKRNIPLISSMGTAKKLHSDKLEIIDIKDTINDPLARIFRKFIKDEFSNKKLTVLSSKELPIETNNNELGSMIFVPAVAGLMIGSYVIQKLGKIV